MYKSEIKIKFWKINKKLEITNYNKSLILMFIFYKHINKSSHYKKNRLKNKKNQK